MQGKFQTLQKQISDLHTSTQLKSAVAAFNESKNENLVKELRQEVIELKYPDYKNEMFFQFTEMQERVIKLQGQLEEHIEKAEQDRNRLSKNSNQMKGLQTQVYKLESDTSAQVIHLQDLVNENGKKDQEDRNKLKTNSLQMKGLQAQMNYLDENVILDRMQLNENT